MKRTKSRKESPWNVESELTETQKFLKNHYDSHYANRHCKVNEDMINSYKPAKYPYCKTAKFKKNGTDKSGVQRYKFICGKIFISTTGTRTYFNKSKYWLQKLFLTLENVRDDIVLSDIIWLDETFYTVRSQDVIRKDDGNKLRGISRNQICIGVATDKNNTLFFIAGTGKPSQKKAFKKFKNHIKPGSTLVHDKESAHPKLVKELALKSEAYLAKNLKDLAFQNPNFAINCKTAAI